MLNSWSTVLWILLGAVVVYPIMAVVLRSDSWWAKIAMFIVVVAFAFGNFFLRRSYG